MPKELVYQPPKWEKERKEEEKVIKQVKGDPVYNNLQRMLKRNQEKLSSQRNYQTIYTSLQLKFKIIANSHYLKNTEDIQSISYTYLSGISGVLSYLFDTPELQKDRDRTDIIDTVLDFPLALMQLYAVDEPIPKSVEGLQHIYVQLLTGNLENTEYLLSQAGTEYNPADPYKLWIGETMRAVIMAIIQKDEKLLRNLLEKRIRNYRKQPVGYSIFIDFYSIAMIKLARKYDLNCEINVIEIPKMFFDREICAAGKKDLELPFYEDAVSELEKRGIKWP